MSISSLYNAIAQLRSQKTALDALPVAPPGLSIAARKAIIDAEIAQLFVDIPQLTVVDQTSDTIVLRDSVTLQEYTIPTTALTPTIYGGGSGLYPDLGLSAFGGWLGAQHFGAKTEVLSLGANRMTLYPLFIPRPMKLQAGYSGMAIPIKTISGGGTRCSLAIYAPTSASNPYPTTKVAHVNNLPAYNANWIDSTILEIADVLLDAQKVYWLALNSEGGDESYWGFTPDKTWQIGGSDLVGAGDAAAELNGYSLARAWNDWSDFPAGQPLVKLAGIPDIRARMLAQ